MNYQFILIQKDFFFCISKYCSLVFSSLLEKSKRKWDKICSLTSQPPPNPHQPWYLKCWRELCKILNISSLPCLPTGLFKQPIKSYEPAPLFKEFLWIYPIGGKISLLCDFWIHSTDIISEMDGWFQNFQSWQLDIHLKIGDDLFLSWNHWMFEKLYNIHWNDQKPSLEEHFRCFDNTRLRFSLEETFFIFW